MGSSEQTYYRWRKEYGGLRLDQAKRLKEFEIGSIVWNSRGRTARRGAVATADRGIVRLIRLDPKNLQSRTIRLQVDATRPGRRLGLV